MPTHLFHLTIHDDPAIDKLVEWTTSYEEVNASVSEPDEQGVRRVDIESPASLIHETEQAISQWKDLHPGVLVRDLRPPGP